ncbi:MAG: molybdopterin-dependent oxidoreductase [Dehalococcoidia bacterium]
MSSNASPWLLWQCTSGHTQIAVSLSLLAVSVAAYLGYGDPPLNGLAEEIMARTPATLANRLLENLGDFARPAAVLGAYALLLFGSLLVAGALNTGRHLGLVAGPLMAVAVTATAHVFGLNSAWLVGGLAAVFYLVVRRWHWPSVSPSDKSKRDFLRLSLLGGAAVLLTASTTFGVSLARNLAIDKDGGRRLFPWQNPHPRDPLYAAAPKPEVDEVRDFYLMSKNVNDPTIDEARWSLKITDLAGEERRFSLGDLEGMPRTDLWATLRCVSNTVSSRLMGTALFSGVALRDLLSNAGEGSFVRFRGDDGQEESLALSELLEVPTMLAYAMNGRELSEGHGCPLRLLVPGRYGFKSVKWLTQIHVEPEFENGTWEDRGWSADAVVKTMSRIDGVVQGTDGSRVAFGVAYGGLRGIQRVEVRVDEGDWLEAECLEPLSPESWVLWRHALETASGRLTVRAVDGEGGEQPADPQGPFPDGAQGLHSISFG